MNGSIWKEFFDIQDAISCYRDMRMKADNVLIMKVENSRNNRIYVVCDYCTLIKEYLSNGNASSLSEVVIDDSPTKFYLCVKFRQPNQEMLQEEESIMKKLLVALNKFVHIRTGIRAQLNNCFTIDLTDKHYFHKHVIYNIFDCEANKEVFFKNMDTVSSYMYDFDYHLVSFLNSYKSGTKADCATSSSALIDSSEKFLGKFSYDMCKKFIILISEKTKCDIDGTTARKFKTFLQWSIYQSNTPIIMLSPSRKNCRNDNSKLSGGTGINFDDINDLSSNYHKSLITVTGNNAQICISEYRLSCMLKDRFNIQKEILKKKFTNQMKTDSKKIENAKVISVVDLICKSETFNQGILKRIKKELNVETDGEESIPFRSKEVISTFELPTKSTDEDLPIKKSKMQDSGTTRSINEISDLKFHQIMPTLKTTNENCAVIERNEKMDILDKSCYYVWINKNSVIRKDNQKVTQLESTVDAKNNES